MSSLVELEEDEDDEDKEDKDELDKELGLDEESDGYLAQRDHLRILRAVPR